MGIVVSNYIVRVRYSSDYLVQDLEVAELNLHMSCKQKNFIRGILLKPLNRRLGVPNCIANQIRWLIINNRQSMWFL
jgi:hypothetical protein